MIIPVNERILIAIPKLGDMGDGINGVVDFHQIPVIAFYIPRNDPMPITVQGVLKIEPSHRFYKFSDRIHLFNPDFGYLSDEDVMKIMNEQFNAELAKNLAGEISGD